jgi:hypothetical protein
MTLLLTSTKSYFATMNGDQDFSSMEMRPDSADIDEVFSGDLPRASKMPEILKEALNWRQRVGFSEKVRSFECRGPDSH